MQAEAINDFFKVLDTTVINAQGNFRQRGVEWHTPLIFKQFTVLITGFSGDCTRIGNLYLQYQRLGYKLMDPQSVASTAP